MSSYLQMGHNTQNLVGETDLEGFKGVVLSPLNREFPQFLEDVAIFRGRGINQILFDPQLYYPRTERQVLRSHKYFPDDMDTADLSNIEWWSQINIELVKYAEELEIDVLTSPVVEPRAWNDEYYYICTQVGDQLKSSLKPPRKCLSTIMTETRGLAEGDTPLRIASLAAETKCDGYYIVFISELEPRREIYDVSELTAMFSLISELKRTEKPIYISFTGPEMILFKCAGADHCCTGNFFNLRRFTRSRYEDPSGGGGQLSYWFEHSLLGFLRERDIIQLQSEGQASLLSVLYSDNHWSRLILENLADGTGEPWLRYAWRQYLSWFWKTELILDENSISQVSEWLKTAEKNWLMLEDEDILLEEPRNDGKWIRPWRQALSKIRKRNL